MKEQQLKLLFLKTKNNRGAAQGMSNESTIIPENKNKVLLIDDDRMHRDYIQRLFENNSSYRLIDITENGNTALIIIRTKKIDLVITDYNLGKTGLWGNQLAQKIRQDYPDIKILFWSAHISDEDIETAKNIGANGYVGKHEPDSILLEAIDVILHGNEWWPEEPDPDKKKILTPMQTKIVRIFIKGEKSKTDSEIAYDLLVDEYREKIEHEGKQKIEDEYGGLDDYISLKRLGTKEKLVATYFGQIFKRTGFHKRSDLYLWAIQIFGSLSQRLKHDEYSDQDINIFTSLIRTKSIHRIAMELIISERDVRNTLIEFGLDDPETQIKVLLNHLEKWSTQQIANQLGIDEEKIKSILKKFGLNCNE